MMQRSLPPPNLPAPPLRGARVLVVENDFLILRELESVLTEAGADIVGLCRTVEGALAVAQTNGVAAAILDIRVGRDSIAPVVQVLASRGIPFVFYTGQVETDPIQAQWPGRKIIAKPADAHEIVTSVARLLKE